MKKKLALLLALCLAISLFAACGSSKTPNSSTDIPSTPPASNSDVPSAQPTADSDLAYIKEKGKLVVGITDFAPMDYKNDAGEWVGFDADMAKAFAESLGVDVEFIEINWITR